MMYPPKPNAYEKHHGLESIPMHDANPARSQRFQSQARVPWSTGLYDCCSDRRNCCITCFCPCITFGQIAEIVDEGSMSGTVSAALYAVISATTGHACMYSCLYRSRIRNQYGLEESPCDDCIVHYCCECCALCQEYRELQNRGFNLVTGWHGNLPHRNQEVAMTPTAPTVEPGMKR